MTFKFVCVLFICIGAIFNVVAQNRIDEKCGVQSSENQYPWLIGIEFKTKLDLTKRIQCTGALISRFHVVTNARCFDKLNDGVTKKSVLYGLNITIAAGSCVGGKRDNHCADDSALRVPIEVVILHPEYDKSIFWSFQAASYYDIALITLREMVPYTDFIRPICLASTDFTQSAETDRELYITGLAPISPNKKLHASMSYLDRAGCQNNIFAEDEICALEVEEVKPCLMDGGLVMHKKKDSYELVGLLTLRSRCHTPRVFSNLFQHLDWIRSNMTESTHGCGRRKVKHIELILQGEATKAGDWPWHVAIYRLLKSSINYTCGGTLISKTAILTAAHCVTIRGVPVNPEILSVTLGKYNLIGRDFESQEREVHSVIAHEKFAPMNHYANDIALLKLRSEATYTDYIQPACICCSEAFDRLPREKDFGTVVGWGIDQSEQLSTQLKQTEMPRVSDMTCIRRNPLFYTNVLENNKKFCAGWANGTSPCNGDSGGGFLVFVPDTAKANSDNAVGSWYVRGIVSLTAYQRNYGRCDPYQYVVFTDVDKYTDWIHRQLIAKPQHLSN